MQSGLTRRTVRPLSVRTAGGNRTRDLTHSQYVALSAELQRYAGESYLAWHERKAQIKKMWINLK